MTLGERVRRRRKQLGLTQVQLATAIGKSNATVAYIELGRNEPHASTLAGLALALDVSADWLLWGREVVLSDRQPGLRRDARRWLVEVEYLPESWKPMDWMPYKRQTDAAAALAVLQKGRAEAESADSPVGEAMTSCDGPQLAPPHSSRYSRYGR